MMEKLVRGPHPAIALMLFAASVALGVLLGVGGPFPAWLAYCLGLAAGASLTALLTIYVFSWAMQASD